MKVGASTVVKLTNYLEYFGTPEKLVETIGCCLDCYVCPFSKLGIPCAHRYNYSDKDIYNWLMEITDNERINDHDTAEPTDHTAATGAAAAADAAAAAAITAAATAAAKSAADAAASAAVAAAAAAAHFVRNDHAGADEQA